MIRLSRRLLVALAFASLAVRPGVAQAVEWERLGEFEFAHALVFYPGAAPDGSLDTMLVRADTEPDSIGVEDNDFFRRALTDTAWVDVNLRIAGLSRDGSVALPSGCVLFGNNSGPKGIEQTCDGGRTWQEIHWPDGEQVEVNCLLHRPSDGVLVGCRDEDDDLIVSADEGLTWAPVGATFPDDAFESLGLAEHPTAGLGPGGKPGPRLVVALLGFGWAFSDDGGLTFTPSSAWSRGRYFPDDLALDAVDGTPFDDRLYATTRDVLSPVPGSAQALLASDDGGATWTTLAYFPTGHARVAVTGDGAVWVGTSEQRNDGQGRIWRSPDGGQTWEDVTGNYGGRPIGADIVEGPDGRVYVAGGGGRAGTPRPDGGLWRTVDPVYAVASAPGTLMPPGASVGLSVAPNPTGGAVTAVVTLAAPGRVRLAVVDARGRAVAVLYDGPAVDGQRVAVETAGLAAGVYRVVATTARGAAASVPLTVAR